MISTTTALAVGSVLALGAFILHRRSQALRSRLPPGPKGVPILGNALQMPRLKEWETFQQWADTYGDVVWVKVLGRPIIILNSLQAATDLTVKRSVKYSSRPHLTMASELVGFEQITPLMPYNATMNASRRLIHREFAQNKVPAYHASVEAESHKLLNRLLQSPEKFDHHVRECAGASLLLFVYGYRVKSEHDHMVYLVERSVGRFSEAAAPGAYLVDFFPKLKHLPSWLPGMEFKRKGALWKKEMEDVVDYCRDGVLNGHNGVQAEPCFFTHALENEDGTPVTDKEQLDLIKWTAISLLGAGADTPVSSLLFFFLALVVNPDAQRRAQAEIDRVVGTDRLPTLEDRDNLPYVNALVSEVLRWYPLSPVGVPHKVTEDDEYNGLVIPKGTTIILNQWAMLHDASVYPEPDKFLPERFLATSDPVADKAKDPRRIAFGFGRRQCPGLHLADAILFSVFSNVLATMNVTKPLDENGQEYMPEVDCTSGNISFPKPFKCTIKPRSEKAETLVHATSDH